jgi:hypothetical protein
VGSASRCGEEEDQDRLGGIRRLRGDRDSLERECMLDHSLRHLRLDPLLDNTHSFPSDNYNPDAFLICGNKVFLSRQPDIKAGLLTSTVPNTVVSRVKMTLDRR